MTPSELLEIALDDSRAEMLPRAVEQLLQARTPEDHRLDYKDAAATYGEKRNALELRRDVASFANSEGGLLIFGVDEEGDRERGLRPKLPPSSISHGSERFDRWAEKAIAQLSPHIVPFPRVRVVEALGAELAVVAVPRAARLVPCPEAGEARFYMRAGEGRFRVPQYLHTDLVLGRRERPDLRIELTGYGPGDLTRNHIGCGLKFCVRNEGLTWAPALRFGIIGYRAKAFGEGWMRPLESRALRERLRLPPIAPESKLLLAEVHGAARELAPFEATGEQQFQVGLPKSESRTTWFGAAFAVPANGPPILRQLSIVQVGSTLVAAALSPSREDIRPVVWWGFDVEWDAAVRDEPTLIQALGSSTEWELHP